MPRFRSPRLTAPEHVAMAQRLNAHLATTHSILAELKGEPLAVLDAVSRASKAIHVAKSRLDDQWYRLPLAARHALTENGTSPYYDFTTVAA